MFVVMRRTVVKEGYADQVVERFKNGGLVEKQEGFIDISVMVKQARRGDEEVVVLARWESEQHWKNWEKSEEHIAAHRAKMGQPVPDYIVSAESGRYDIKLVKEAAK